MTPIVIIALLLSSIIYVYIGLKLKKGNKSIADFLPLSKQKSQARISSVDEFSTSTVATTVSLATIVLAYFELAGAFGFILFWTVITTTIGMLLVSLLAKRIWNKMSTYKNKPSLHEFLGTEYNSKSVAMVASICTSLGFLLIFATELIVGSRFLASLVPEIPEWITVIFLTFVGFFYTLSGFKTVIKTDQLQMKMIWAFIISLGLFYVYHIVTTDWQTNWAKLPENITSINLNSSLWAFIIGIAVMNIPTHISSMAVFQRISAAENPDIVVKGFKRSIWGIAFSWGLLVILACFAYMIVTPENPKTLLPELLTAISSSIGGKLVLFISVLGLFASMLSTASTNLIVVTHTLSEDVFAKFKNKSLEERIDSKNEFKFSKRVLAASALVAILLVEGLKQIGFSIADLVFAIYSGSLVLFPLIMVSLFHQRKRLAQISFYASLAVIFGFLAGWGSAIFGKLIGDGNLIFLSPVIGICISGTFIIVGLIMNRTK
ncbi:hypothetical protein [Gaetbulibacter jejuensis]|uniref:hypothetical protein n=1 Tax=Gaetbulibacter jejuensis TaxID=584607 RepID=UPI00300A2BE0